MDKRGYVDGKTEEEVMNQTPEEHKIRIEMEVQKAIEMSKQFRKLINEGNISLCGAMLSFQVCMEIIKRSCTADEFLIALEQVQTIVSKIKFKKLSETETGVTVPDGGIDVGDVAAVREEGQTGAGRETSGDTHSKPPGKRPWKVLQKEN